MIKILLDDVAAYRTKSIHVGFLVFKDEFE